MRVRVRVRVRVRAMIMMALALAAIITRAGAVTGQGHRLRSTGHCKAGYPAVSESECADIGRATAGYSWGYANEFSSYPPGCFSMTRHGTVYYNRRGVDGGGNDCSAYSSMRCICACVSGRYSSSTTPADGECTACDSGKRFSTSVLLAVHILTYSLSLITVLVLLSVRAHSLNITHLLTYLLLLAYCLLACSLLPSSFSFPSFALPLCFFASTRTSLSHPHPHSLSSFVNLAD